VVSRTADHQEANQPRHIVPSPPRANFGKRIGADHEVEFIARGQHRPHLLDGIDRVAAHRALFQAGDFEARLRRAGKFHHADAVLVRCVGDARFVRRMGSGNEEDAVQRAPRGSFAGHCQMARVNRIEGAAKDRQFHGVRLYVFSIFTELSRTSFTGRSPALRGTFEIFSTTS